VEQPARSVTARDPAGRIYRLDVYRVPPSARSVVAPGGIVLRFNGQPVEWVGRGAYRIKAGFSPSGLDTDLTCDDPDAP
jgi:hypothetical protein